MLKGIVTILLFVVSTTFDNGNTKFQNFEQYIFPKLDNFEKNLISAEFIHLGVCLSLSHTFSLSLYMYIIFDSANTA